jgi:hypothetical protein
MFAAFSRPRGGETRLAVTFLVSAFKADDMSALCFATIWICSGLISSRVLTEIAVT